ncbi:MAG: DivIVA domain-containing protein [Ruminococcus sp.]|nr:DivIVA domain-containing protein [Candidatus Apopatosoma intestinale]
MPNQQGNSANRHFSRSIRGYNISEVNEYLNRLSENYAVLYRENVELEQKLSDAQSRLENLDKEEEQVKRILETAKRAADQVVNDAYARADDILASVKKSCDGLLANFRDKIEARKNDLANIQENVGEFKKELFEKYRLHIELIDQLVPVYEYDELTSDRYVDRMITNLKKEVAAQYDIKLEDILTEEEQQGLLRDRVDDMANELEKNEQKEAAVPVKKPKSIVPSVMELLDEYEGAAAAETDNLGKQLTLDIDALLPTKKSEKIRK